jgi:molybdenum cofactor cytidylyltransferase/nicotine blue oxidoreductase
VTDSPTAVRVVGILLAAGAGTRMGTPKALVTDLGGVPWVRSAAEALRAGGCEPVLVVLGAAYEEAKRLVPDFSSVVEAADWADGMSASLRAGLRAAADIAPSAEAALVHLVDLPDVGADVVARLLGYAAPGALVRATYDGKRPGHPVLLGRDHWHGAIESVHGDHGARDYLSEYDATTVDCGDLATGVDVDTRSG